MVAFPPYQVSRKRIMRILILAAWLITWLMRLEGLGRDQWEPEIESARQTYKLLAEQAQSKGDAQQAKSLQEDLEAAIRWHEESTMKIADLRLTGLAHGTVEGGWAEEL